MSIGKAFFKVFPNTRGGMREDVKGLKVCSGFPAHLVHAVCPQSTHSSVLSIIKFKQIEINNGYVYILMYIIIFINIIIFYIILEYLK